MKLIGTILSSICSLVFSGTAFYCTLYQHDVPSGTFWMLAAILVSLQEIRQHVER